VTIPFLPPGAVSVRRTPEFSEASVPPGLLHRHATKRGVWAVIHVLEGTLTFRTLEPVPLDTVLTPGQPGLIEPERLHEVEPHGSVRFFVEFFELPGAEGPRGQ
jgi:tellurite resistance-related uncharacterized protein